jgi:hypothetical protein
MFQRGVTSHRPPHAGGAVASPRKVNAEAQLPRDDRLAPDLELAVGSVGVDNLKPPIARRSGNEMAIGHQATGHGVGAFFIELRLMAASTALLASSRLALRSPFSFALSIASLTIVGLTTGLSSDLQTSYIAILISSGRSAGSVLPVACQ